MLQVSIETGIAEEYLAAKLSVLPAVREKKCPAVGKWKVWQERLPTDVEIRAWFANRHDAICIICGKMSVLAEWDAQDREDLIYLEKLPLFDSNGNAL